MPTSFWKHISYVIEQGRKDLPRSVLDIGIGFGKWGFLFREFLDIYGNGDHWSKKSWKTRIDGIEVYEPYLKDLEKTWYDEIYVGDVLEVIPDLQDYDLTLMMDVLEHIPKAEGQLLLDIILKKSKKFIVSVPLGDFLYEFKGENKAESHVSIWTEDELKTYSGYKKHKIYKLVTTGGKKLEVGVFIYEN